MAGDPFDPRNFFAALGEFEESGGTAPADKDFRLATVDPAFTGTGFPRLTFDGETSLTLKAYPYVGALPAPGARVVLAPVGSSYVILGTLGGGIAAFEPPRGVVAKMKRTTTSGEHSTVGPHKIMELSCPMKAGREYEIHAKNIGMFTFNAGSLRAILSMTTNGAVPTATSGVQLWIQTMTIAGSNVESEQGSFLYAPSVDLTARILLSATLIVGSGNWGIYARPEWPLDFYVEDKGPAISASGTQF